MRVRLSGVSFITLVLIGLSLVASVPVRAAVDEGGLSPAQRQQIETDVRHIASLGFKRIRIITFVRYRGEQKKRNWPSDVFLSFPKPTDDEIKRLRQYLAIVDAAGLGYDFMMLMPGPGGRYYIEGVTGADYKSFVDGLWPVLSTGRLKHLLIGGDLALNPRVIDEKRPNRKPVGRNIVDGHRRWISEIWPHLAAKCGQCNIGIGLRTAHASFWDLGAGSLQWIRKNIKPAPKFVGVQYYPTTRAVMRHYGFVRGGRPDWDLAVRTWYGKLKAAAGDIPLLVDEVGLNRVRSYTTQERAGFYRNTLSYFIKNGIDFNLWQYADRSGMSRYGLVDDQRRLRPFAGVIADQLRKARSSPVSAGIQYIPPESVGLQYIMPADPKTAGRKKKQRARARSRLARTGISAAPGGPLN